METGTCSGCARYEHKWNNYIDVNGRSYGPAGTCALLDSANPAIVHLLDGNTLSIPSRPEIVLSNNPCNVLILPGCLFLFQKPRPGFEER